MGAVLLQSTVSGLFTGALFGLIAVGLALTFGVMRIVNFAHGEFLMVAMYTTFLVSTYGKLSPYLAILVTVPFLFVLGVVMFRLLIQPLLDAPETSQILMTMGASILLENVALMIFKGNPITVGVPWANESLVVGPLSLGLPKVIAFGLSVFATLGIYLVFKHTDLGRMLRAAAQDRNAAQLMGIDVRRMYMLALALGVACLGIAGPALLPWSYVSPDVGSPFTMTSFIVVVMGGMGSISGAFLSGLIIGVVAAVGQAMLPGTYGLIPQYVVFMLLLLFKPQGLFTERI